MDFEAIHRWKAPSWHPDLGDPHLELSILRTVTLELLRCYPRFEAQLDCFEPGYMQVQFTEAGVPFATLLVTELRCPVCAWFADQESMPDALHEVYFQTSEELLRELRLHLA